MVYRLVFFRMTRFRYFAVGEYQRHKYRKPYTKESNICFYWKRVQYDISLKIKVESQKQLRKEPKNLLIETSTRRITYITIRLRDLYDRLFSEKENKLWITFLFFWITRETFKLSLK